MSIVTTDSAHYQNIASKIREKKGTDETIFPSEMPKKIEEVYEAGYEKGKAEGGGGEGGINIYHYFTTDIAVEYTFKDKEFAPNTDFIFEATNANFWYFYGPFFGAKNIKTIKVITPENMPSTGSIATSAFRECAQLETVDLTDCHIKFKTWSYAFFNSSKLKSVDGALDFSLCTQAASWVNNANALEDMEFVPNTIKISLSFGLCTKLTKATIESIIAGLSNDVSGQALTLSTTAVNNAFETTAGAADGSTSEAWLALVATKPNWTISLE